MVGDPPDWVEVLDHDEVHSFIQPRYIALDCFGMLAMSSANLREVRVHALILPRGDT